jgi:hypothetical protein
LFAAPLNSIAAFSQEEMTESVSPILKQPATGQCGSIVLTTHNFD